MAKVPAASEQIMEFPTTNWTALAEATVEGGESEKVALENFCNQYWHPIAMMIQVKGGSPDRIEDLTQDFFLKLIERDFMRRAAREKGSFRNFLLKALNDFLIDDARHTKAAKRGGGVENLELAEDSVPHWDSDLVFDRAWAESVFNIAVEEVAKEVKRKRSDEQWRVLQFFLTVKEHEVSYEDLGIALGLKEGAAKTEVSRMRKRFREHLRFQVGKTVSAPHEIEEELAFLRDVMMANQDSK